VNDTPDIERQLLAYHEAGHAVIAWARSVRLRSVQLHEDSGLSVDAQHFLMYDPVTMSASQWQHAKTKALILLAGEAAERGFQDLHGACVEGDWAESDRQEFDSLIEDLFGDEGPVAAFSRPALVREVDCLIEENWGRIEKLAAALIERRHLTGAEAEAIIASS